MKGFRDAELEEVCIARRTPSGSIETWDGTSWRADSDYAMIFPSTKEMKDYLAANPALAKEMNLKVVKVSNI
jgi:hypothetical protein